MALLKSRPEVRVRVPREIRPGSEFEALVQLDCRRPVEIEGVDVRLTASERWKVGGGEKTVGRHQVLLRLGARLGGERRLPAGRTELPVRFPLPARAPPSYRGKAAHIEYALEVHVRIPWWPDRRASFEIHVAPAPVPSPAPEPQVFSSGPDGPAGSEPHAEVSLASRWTRVGDIVNGALALSNVAHNRYSEVRVGLRSVETVYDRGVHYSEHEHLSYQVRLGVEQAREGEMIPFRFRLPDDAPCDLPLAARPPPALPLCSLRWEFEVVVGIRWGKDLVLRVPFSVLPRSERPGDAPPRLAPPSVGSDRLRALWEACGREHGLRYEGQTLRGQLGGTTLTIRRDHLGRSGIFLVAELSYPELHLDLEVTPATRLQRMVGEGVRIGDPTWDRDHLVRARDPEQVAELLRAIVPALRNARLRRMDDRRLTAEVRDAGTSPARMRRFVAAAAHLTRTFEGLRGHLPPPSGLRGALAEWRDLAARLGGELETARMRIEGRLGEMEVGVRLAFGEAGRPLGTWLGVRPSGGLDAEHEVRLRAVDEAPLAALEARFEGDALALARSLAHGAEELLVERDRVSLRLPWLLGVPPDAPPGATARGRPTIAVGGATAPAGLSAAGAERKLSRLVRLVALLRHQAGPYR